MSWISERNAPESLVILGALSDLCADLGGPLTRKLNDLRKSDLKQLLSFEMDYSEFGSDSRNGILDAIYARQILGFYQKAEFLELGIDRSLVAAERFLEAEERCKWTNRRICYSRANPNSQTGWMHAVIFTAQQKIANILGNLPSLDTLDFAFGPGANTNVKGSISNPRVKLGVALECSSKLSPTVGDFLEEVPAWCEVHSERYDEKYVLAVDVVPGKLIFVPKNAKTDRSIVVEPILNSFCQKGYGSYIRKRLLYSGVDLRDQTRNQALAKKSSEDGTLSTLDLSMASDCLSREVVYELLPYEWSETLDRIRTNVVTLPSNMSEDMLLSRGLDPYSYPELQLEKFSSMGNGFTFELESLIFYAIAFAVVKLNDGDTASIGVYGDDIVIPVDCTQQLVESLEFLGFSINPEKSFSTGGFRESCGADYLHGFDIRPFYQKTLISDRTLYTMHNWFFRHGEYELAALVKTFVQPSQILLGPDGFGDGHLIGTHKLRQNRQMIRKGWCGGYFDTYALRVRRYSKFSPGDAVLPVYSVYTRSGEKDPTDPDIVRGSRGYAKVSIYTLGTSILSRKS